MAEQILTSSTPESVASPQVLVPSTPEPSPGLVPAFGGWVLAVAVGSAWVWRVLQSRSPEPVISREIDHVLDGLALVLTAHAPFRGMPLEQVRQSIPDLEAVATLIEVPDAVERIANRGSQVLEQVSLTHDQVARLLDLLDKPAVRRRSKP